MMSHSYNNKGGPDGGSSLNVIIGISLGISFLLLFLIILIVLGITLKKKQGEKLNGAHTPTDKPGPVAPVYEEVASDSLSGQNKIIELKENVAYGPI